MRFMQGPSATSRSVLDFMYYGFPVGHCAYCPNNRVYPLTQLTLVKIGEKIRHLCKDHLTGGEGIAVPAQAARSEEFFRRERERRRQAEQDRQRREDEYAAEALRLQDEIQGGLARRACPPSVLPPLTEENKATFVERWLGPVSRMFRP